MKIFASIREGLEALRFIPLFLFRVYLAWVFLNPFLIKAANPADFARFLDRLGYPFPEVSAWLALITEGAGVLLLLLGLLTRLITFPLMFLLVLAIVTVHWGHGYNVCEGGWELQLTYLLLLLGLLTLGPGAISLDALIKRKYQ